LCAQCAFDRCLGGPSGSGIAAQGILLGLQIQRGVAREVSKGAGGVRGRADLQGINYAKFNGKVTKVGSNSVTVDMLDTAGTRR
jgi:hypothetical protein